ncbi:hypothetical protein V6N13_084171 [Hibiscus sabdariffa]
MEPRVSGRKANAIIAHHGFTSSFRIEASGFAGGIWLMWNDIIELEVIAVKEASMVSNLESFVREVSVWNREVFVHLGKRKARLLARIWGIEKALEFSSSTNLQELEQVRAGMGWCVRDGCQIDFWFDDWLSGTGVLAPKYLLDGVSAPCPVVSFVAPDGQWNIEALMQVLPADYIY